MIKKINKIVYIIVLAMIMSSCAVVKEGKEDIPKVPEVVEVEKDDPIKEKINAMSIDEKIGQMFIVGFEGYEADSKIKDLIEKRYVGGVIFFDRNINSSNSLLQLMNSLKDFNKNNKAPLFMSIDEEGGRVSRLPKEIKRFPSSMSIGKTGDSNISFQVGEITGEKLKAFGFNMDFAPVLDIYSNSKNKVIGDRAFGVEPERVKKFGVATMKGLSEQGVIPVIKHFPGHGDTTEDSHLKLPVVYHDYTRLESFELIPFKYAIEQGADAIMIAHILLPMIDKDYPASISKNIITDLLRNKLNFNGVVITDDMEMQAIAKNYTIEDAALKSVKAGSDIILICKNYENSIKAIDKIKLSVKKNEILEERIDESVYRILELKSRYKIQDRDINNIDIDSLNTKTQEVLSQIKHK